MEDLQQSRGLEDLEAGGGGGVERRHGPASRQVAHHLVEEEAPAQELGCVVGDQVEFGDHDGALDVRSALAGILILVSCVKVRTKTLGDRVTEPVTPVPASALSVLRLHSITTHCTLEL